MVVLSVTAESRVTGGGETAVNLKTLRLMSDRLITWTDLHRLIKEHE